MAHVSKLTAEKRTKLGSREARRLRARGVIPGNIYGHKQDNLAVVVPKDVLAPIVHAGHRVVDIEVDGESSKAMFREVQWDTFGVEIQHFDLVRVDPDERVTLELPVELRGIAPGTLAGGVLDTHLRSLRVDCLAIQIPDSIPVKVSHLEIGQSVHVKDLEVPEGMHIQDSPDELIVQVIKPQEAAETEEGGIGPAEPEIIGRKAAEESED